MSIGGVLTKQIEVRSGVRRHQLGDDNLRLRACCLPRLADPVAGVTIRLAADLVHHVERRPSAAPPVLRIGEDVDIPVQRGTPEEARPAHGHGVVDRWKQPGCLVGLDEADCAGGLVR